MADVQTLELGTRVDVTSGHAIEVPTTECGDNPSDVSRSGAFVMVIDADGVQDLYATAAKYKTEGAAAFQSFDKYDQERRGRRQ